MLSFSLGVKETPGVCSPSRRVVSMISSFMTLTFLFVFFPRAKSRFHGEIEENYQTQYSRNETEMLLLFLFSIFFEIMRNMGEIV